MCGVYVKYIDFDDYLGLCECASNEGGTNFPGLSSIVSAVKNNETADCDTFGNAYKNWFYNIQSSWKILYHKI